MLNILIFAAMTIAGVSMNPFQTATYGDFFPENPALVQSTFLQSGVSKGVLDTKEYAVAFYPGYFNLTFKYIDLGKLEYKSSTPEDDAHFYLRPYLMKIGVGKNVSVRETKVGVNLNGFTTASGEDRLTGWNLSFGAIRKMGRKWLAGLSLNNIGLAVGYKEKFSQPYSIKAGILYSSGRNTIAPDIELLYTQKKLRPFYKIIYTRELKRQLRISGLVQLDTDLSFGNTTVYPLGLSVEFGVKKIALKYNVFYSPLGFNLKHLIFVGVMS